MLNSKIKKVILIFFIILFCASLALNGWFFYQLSTALSAYHSQQNNANVISFTGMFVEKVLMATQDIDFDTRLSLETAVRGLNDQDIFGQWQKFIKATDKTDASNQAKIFLDLLVKKMSH